MDQKRKILVVDDEPDVIEYLTSLLEDNGYEVRTALNGKVAMELVKDDKPDLICLDISMPEETGVRMLRNLHDDDRTKDIPVIIVSGVDPKFKDFISHRKQVNPPSAYFEKPIDKHEFLNAIRTILSGIGIAQ